MNGTANNNHDKNHEGFIPLMRRFKDNSMWLEKRKFSRAEAWIDLLFKARYNKGPEEVIDRGEKIILNEGDVLTSILTLSKNWRWSRTRVKNFISFLNQNGSLKIIRLDNRRLIINIVKFGYFKNIIQQTGHQTGHQTGQQKCNRKTYNNKDNKDNKDNINIVSKDTIDDTRQEDVVLPDEKEYGNHYVNLVIHYYKKYKGEQPIDKKLRYHAYNISRKILNWIEKNKEYADFLYERVKSNYRPSVSLFEHFLIKMFLVLREKDFFEKIKRLETFYHHMKPIFEQYTTNVVRAYEEYKILKERKKLQEREEKIKKLKQEYYLAKEKIRELEEGLSQNTSKIPDYMIKETKKTIEEEKQKMLEVKKQLETYGQTIA